MVGMSSISPTTSSTTTPAANYSAFSTPLTASTISPLSAQAPKPTGYQAAQPNYFSSVSTAPPAAPAASSNPVAAPGKAPGGDAFGALWSQASVGIKKSAAPTSGPALGQLAKEKSSAGIWGRLLQAALERSLRLVAPAMTWLICSAKNMQPNATESP